MIENIISDEQIARVEKVRNLFDDIVNKVKTLKSELAELTESTESLLSE